MRYKGINYRFRPKSYWEDQTLEQAVLKNIKGSVRREEIKEAIKNGSLENIPEGILSDKLSETLKIAFGRIHPRFMGGEYLPDYAEAEVEIARISLQSTTFDVISIRATPAADGQINYRIVDEYKAKFVLPFTSSDKPLSLGQLVDFLEESYLEKWLWGNVIVGYNNYNAEYCTKESLRNFTTITSEFYKELETHCDKVIEDWVNEEEEEE